jgi:hypothetical protein
MTTGKDAEGTDGDAVAANPRRSAGTADAIIKVPRDDELEIPRSFPTSW